MAGPSNRTEGYPGRRVVDNWTPKTQLPVAMTTSYAVIFTAAKKTRIKSLKAVCHDASTDRLFSVCIGANGFTAGNGNLYDNITVTHLGAGAEFIPRDSALVLEKGQQIQAKAAAAAGNITITYEEEV